MGIITEKFIGPFYLVKYAFNPPYRVHYCYRNYKRLFKIPFTNWFVYLWDKNYYY